ncbi:hypothetical protein [Granulicella arctica]|uniref:hypothetical protein n=1 Tax=Granulicella arctica TaxID=940613 RepID=UPI0021DF670A|nr:hypothetical protein [Granulicella arctica]
MATVKEDDLPDKLSPVYGLAGPHNVEELFFTCQIGARLWREYHAAHPGSPERPP